MSTDALNQQIQELERLRRQTRCCHFYTVLAIAAIVMVGVGAILNSAYGLTRSGPKQEEFLVHLGGHLQTNVLPVAHRLAEGSVKRLKPALEVELKELDARAPQVAEAALTELAVLGANLPLRAGTVLEQTLGDTLQKRQDKLRKMYPAVTEQQMAVLVDNLHAETQDQLLKTGVQLFQPHLNSIQSILANVEKMANAEPVGSGQEIDSWQVAFLFLDVFTHEFRELAGPGALDSEETKK